MENYQKDYTEFMGGYKSKQTSAEEVGELICRMAQYYSEINTKLGAKTEAVNQVAKIDIEAMDEVTDKPISATKAKVMTEASTEHAEYDRCRKDLQNVEQMINALKALQKGVLNEYSHVA